MAWDPKLKVEIGLDGLAREAPVIAYTEKVILPFTLDLMIFLFLWKPDNRGRAASAEEVSSCLFL